MQPHIQAALTLFQVNEAFGCLDLAEFISELDRQVSAVKGGDLARAEGMLFAQAYTLDALFHMLTRRAAANTGTYLDAVERYLRLALKAQSQCRTALETLALIKNPPATFVRAAQANIAAGHQQVVNHPLQGAADPSRAWEPAIPTNELLDNRHGERLDCGAAAATVGGDQEMETVGAVERAPNARR